MHVRQAARRIECQGRIVRVQRSQIRIVAGVNIAPCIVASRQTVNRGIRSTLDRVRGYLNRNSKVSGCRPKSRISPTSITLNPLWHLL